MGSEDARRGLRPRGDWHSVSGRVGTACQPSLPLFRLVRPLGQHAVLTLPCEDTDATQSRPYPRQQIFPHYPPIPAPFYLCNLYSVILHVSTQPRPYLFWYLPLHRP